MRPVGIVDCEVVELLPRDSKVRRISQPDVVLRVRETDPEGLLDGTPKALCADSYGNGKWIPLDELERTP